MNLNRKRAPSGRKDFLEKNSRFFTGHALPEKMPAVSSDTERKRPADLSGVFRKGQAISGPRCMKCGRPVKMEEEYCEDCRKGAHHLRRAEVFSGTERSGDSLWYDLSITDVGNMGIFMQRQ